jgi:hypothetical protein
MNFRSRLFADVAYHTSVFTAMRKVRRISQGAAHL